MAKDALLSHAGERACQRWGVETSRDYSLQSSSTYSQWGRACTYSKSLEKGGEPNINSDTGRCAVSHKANSRGSGRSVVRRVRIKRVRSFEGGGISERSTLCRIRFDRTSVYPKVVCEAVMALVPRDMFRNRWDELHRLHRELEERFKRLSMRDDMWIPPMPAFEDFLMPPLPPTTALFDDFEKSMRKTFEQMEQQIGGTAIVHSNQDVYRVVVDVQQFAPEEITVRTDNKCITVEGKHEEKKDQHGFVSRHFVRRYVLPQGYDIGHVKPSLSSDGVLTITAPKLAMPAPGERIVQIQRINAPAIKAA